MTLTVQNHYNQQYFDYQTPFGKLGGWQHPPLFAPYIEATDTVLDFGCGGGWVLKNLQCQRRVGVEINPAAAGQARENGIEVHPETQAVADESVDVVITRHALEHCPDPLRELGELYRVLRPGGRIVAIVPCESVFRGYKPNDPNHHLFTWSPMCFGNLLTEAGFNSVEAKAFLHRPPPKVSSPLVARVLGWKLFNLLCRVYGTINPNLAQVKATGVKEASA